MKDSLTTDRSDPRLREHEESGPRKGQQKAYLVLSDEERAKGFIRPVRRTYRHSGIRPKYPLRDLTPEEQGRHAQWGYVKFEAYPESDSSITGRFWTEAQRPSRSPSRSRMRVALAETWARRVDFYGGTWCCQCGAHLPVEEFTWIDAQTGADTGEVLGS